MDISSSSRSRFEFSMITLFTASLLSARRYPPHGSGSERDRRTRLAIGDDEYGFGIAATSKVVLEDLSEDPSKIRGT